MDLDAAPAAELLADGFASKLLPSLRDPFRATCARAADWAPEAPADLIRRAAALRGQPAWVFGPRAPTDERPLDAICREFGPCRVQRRDPELETMLEGLLWALYDGLTQVRAHREPLRGDDWWVQRAGSGLLLDRQGGYDPTEPSDRAYLAQDRGPLAGAAARIAEAVLATDWPEVAAGSGELQVETPVGWVRVGMRNDDVHPADGPPDLLTVDAGGDDLYLGDAGATRDGDHRLAVAVDVFGADRYAYPEAAEHPLDGSPLPADGAGRSDVYEVGRQVAASRTARQGAGRAGIGMLFDLGSEGDRYGSLRGSQGYGQMGVGLLYDAGGSDVYAAEEASQGVGQYGMGLLVDAGPGADRYLSLSKSQGHGFVGGVGVLIDGGGADAYLCRPGDPVRYPSPQDPEVNVSLCQGAGFGYRADDPSRALSGGIGVLVDRGGSDRYEAGIYAQGVGYWQGVGWLFDAAGDDDYRSVRYGGGAGVHYGVGVLVDAGGSDLHRVSGAGLGLGYDFGVGVLEDREGDDVYEGSHLTGGASVCGAVGILWDEQGADVYAVGRRTLGWAESSVCLSHPSKSLFTDSGGEDAYPDDIDAGNRRAWSGTEGPTAIGVGADAPLAPPAREG